MKTDALAGDEPMNLYEFRGAQLPHEIEAELRRYATKRQEPSRIVRAILANDLARVICTADKSNLAALPAIVSFIVNELPDKCHGSYASVAAWLEN